MFERIISGPDCTSSGFIDLTDGGIMFLVEGKGKVSYDEGASFIREMAIKDFSTNTVRLPDGRIMAIQWITENDEMVKKLDGGSYFVLYSSDEGATWTTPHKIHEGERCYYTMNDRLLRLSTGRIILPVCLHPESLYNVRLEAAGWCAVYFSDDDGKTWQWSNWLKGEAVGGHLAEPAVIEFSGGVLKMFMRTFAGYLYESVSTDYGATWLPEMQTSVRMPNAPFYVSTDPYSGYVFIVWDNSFPAPDNYNYPRTPICLGVSRDGTNTWEFICDLEADPKGSFGYPSIHFTKDSVLVTYYFNHNEQRTYLFSQNRMKLKTFNRSELTVRKFDTHPLF